MALFIVGSYNSKIYALNAQTGRYEWSFATGDMVISRPAVADGMVYVGGWDGKLYALNSSNGDFGMEFCHWRRS